MNIGGWVLAWVLVLAAGMYVVGRAVYPQVRKSVAAREQEQQSIRLRAEQQDRWASRGDLRGVYGPDGAELMRTLSPAPPISPPGDAVEVAEVVATSAELDELLRRKLPCWRYAAFVSVLTQRRMAVQDRLRDARMGFAQPSGETASTGFVTGRFFVDRLGELSDLIGQVDGFMLCTAFQEVFGDPHDEHSADARGIVHAGNRLMDYHDRLLALNERCRGISVPADCSDLQRDCSLLTAMPLEGFNRFIDDFGDRVVEMADVARYATGDVWLDPVELSVSGGDELLARVSRRLQELARSG